MAELIHLDAAAKLVGKSEVTLRRLVKAGKVKVVKQKTLTGFIYQIDPDEIRAYYNQRGSLGLGSDPAPRIEVEPDAPAAETEAEEPAPKKGKHAVASQGRVRVAVSSEHGDPVEYWVRRAESYEDRYHSQVQNNAELREELGLWRGRAEHANALLMKLLPSPSMVQVSEQRQVPNQPDTVTVRRLTFAGMIVVIALPILLIVGGVLYFLVVFKK